LLLQRLEEISITDIWYHLRNKGVDVSALEAVSATLKDIVASEKAAAKAKAEAAAKQAEAAKRSAVKTFTTSKDTSKEKSKKAPKTVRCACGAGLMLPVCVGLSMTRCGGP